MAGYGWAYLVVTHSVEDARVWRSSDEGTFASESDMLRELGVTGWELTSVRESSGRVVYYFKRPRA